MTIVWYGVLLVQEAHVQAVADESDKNIKLFLDGNQLNYDITSNADSWLIYVTYTHSSHQISINLPTNADVTPLSSKEYWTWIVVAIIIVLIGTSPLVYFRKHKHRN